MRDKVKNILYNPWVITIGSGIIIFFFTSALKSFIADINFVEAIKFVYFYLFNLVKSILLFKIPLWIYLLMSIIIVIIIALILKFKTQKKPSWTEYKSDYVKGMLFTWDYIKTFGKFKITNLRPICSECNCELSRETNNTNPRTMGRHYLYCPNCEEEFKMINQKTMNDVQKIITNRIKNNNFKQKENIKED